MEDKESGRRSRKGTAAVLAGLAALALLVSAGRAIRQRGYEREEGRRLFDAGEYMQAKACYEQAGDERMAVLCDAYALEQRYLNGRRGLQSGDYEKARDCLTGIADYKDAANLLLACDYAEAGDLAARGELERARELYLDLGEYPGAVQRLRVLNDRLYDYAAELADSSRLEHAVKIWTELGDWRDCAAKKRLGEMALTWLERDESEYLTAPARRFDSGSVHTAYVCETAYLYVPEKTDADTRFLLYYPGGYNEELYIDYFHYFLMNPPPNTIAVFLRQNGIDGDVQAKTREGIELLLRAGAECGVFLKAPTVVGSSLGAYPALFGALSIWRDFGMKVPCVAALDAAGNWGQEEQMPSMAQLCELGEIHPDLYLFDNPGQGEELQGVWELVSSGNRVCMVDCTYDEHNRMTLDAMGMGVLHWLVGDRTEPCGMEIYHFRQLSE